VAETTSGKPYSQVDDIRTFSEDVESEELIWHRDKYYREITVLEGDGWKLQLDNQLAKKLEKGKIYKIPAMEFHRVIKGKGNLVIKIWEQR
jgi:quercetin dioxygenase-like cupin family protein